MPYPTAPVQPTPFARTAVGGGSPDQRPWWRLLTVAAALGLALVLAACGGGGDGGGNPGAGQTPTPPATFNVSGVLVGLAANQTLVLVVTDASGNNPRSATLEANGTYTVAQVPAGTSFVLSVQTQPVGQTCVVTDGTGTVSANINTTRVNCSDNPYTLSGSISNNLGTVSLRNSGNGDVFTTSGQGAFRFTQTVPHGSAYSVIVNSTTSAGQSCTVMNGSGTATANVVNLQVNCVAAPPAPPATPTVLAVAYSPKRYTFNWTSSSGALYYEMAEDPDGVGGQAEAAIGGSITTTSYNHDLTTLLHKRLNAQYRVRACNSLGCSAFSAAITPNLTQAIAYLKASNTGASDQFGTSVALSADGNTLAVSAPGEASNATGVGGNQADDSTPSSGAVYVFTRNGGAWSQQAYLKASNTGLGDRFGTTLALSADGNTLAVGAAGESSAATGVGGNQTDNSANRSGAVYVFTRSGGTWSQQAYLKASNAGADDSFGFSLAMSADGNTLAVGAYGEASNATGVGGNQADNSQYSAGAVYVFTRSGVIWSQQAYLKASNMGQFHEFGSSLGLSADGNTLAVGAYGEASNATGVGGNQANDIASSSGAVYVFTRSAGTWGQQAYLKASNTGRGDRFGATLALSADGNTLAVGANEEESNATGVGGNQTDNSAERSGAVYVFTRSSGTWSQQAYLKASITGAGDRFGTTLALSADGNTLAVGANAEDSNATGVGGNQTNTANEAGAAYVY